MINCTKSLLVWVVFTKFSQFWVVFAGCGWLWVDLAGFRWLWLVLSGFGWFWQFLSSISDYFLRKNFECLIKTLHYQNVYNHHKPRWVSVFESPFLILLQTSYESWPVSKTLFFGSNQVDSYVLNQYMSVLQDFCNILTGLSNLLDHLKNRIASLDCRLCKQSNPLRK